MGLGLEGAGWLGGRQGEAMTSKEKLVGGQANEPSSCSGSHLLEALRPPPDTPALAVAPGWTAGEGDSLTTKTGGQRLSHFDHVPHCCAQLPPGMAPQQEQRGLGGRWRGSGMGELSEAENRCTA